MGATPLRLTLWAGAIDLKVRLVWEVQLNVRSTGSLGFIGQRGSSEEGCTFKRIRGV